MKKSFLKLLCLATLSAGSLWGQLVFEQEQITHDASLLEERSEGVFHFTNTGNTPITIQDVQSSCGCTVPTLAKKTYQPGESGEIVAIFTFGARVGKQVKRITVKLEEPGSRPYTLTMVTNIPEWLVIEPRILRWKADQPDLVQQFRVTVADPKNVRLEQELPEAKSFQLSFEQESDTVYVYSVKPVEGATRATEFIQLSATVMDGAKSKTRQFGIHCLIR